MVATAPTQTNGHRTSPRGKTLYDEAVLGFTNYWYPACVSKDVTEREPRAMKLLGNEVVFVRRTGKAYALLDECPHRGTRLSRGKYEFPGTSTLTCRYHGWTFDVTSGSCVAALTDGPESPVVGKVRVRTFPVEERKGIVWIWMGKMAPVPLEDDVPPLVLRDDTVVHTVRRTAYGNWRWHAENVGMGHAAMLHRDSVKMLFTQMFAYGKDFGPVVDVEGEDGEWLLDRIRGVGMFTDYPGLGKWPTPRRWRKVGGPRYRQPLQDVRTIVALRLPGITRVPQFPQMGSMHYEWYVPVDEDHYVYFQVSCAWPNGIWGKLSFLTRFYTWGRPAGLVRFNSQDLSMVGDSRDSEKRHGTNLPSSLYRPDAFQLAWRDLCNRTARGEGSDWQTSAAAKERQRVTAPAPAEAGVTP